MTASWSQVGTRSRHGRPTPTRMRPNSVVPMAPMIDLRPLLPPAVPVGAQADAPLGQVEVVVDDDDVRPARPPSA